jgi:HlyD family secretion protein
VFGITQFPTFIGNAENSFNQELRRQEVNMKKIWWITGIVLVLAAAGFVFFRVRASGQASTTTDLVTTAVRRGTLTATLSAAGTVRFGQSAVIDWQTSGQVGDVYAKLGDQVDADQKLAALDPNKLSPSMINAKQSLIDAKKALDDLLNSKVQRAQALQAVDDAQKALDDLKQTAAENASQAQLALADAQQALKDAQKNRVKMNYPHTTDPLVIEKAHTDYLLAKQTHKEALKEYNKVKRKKMTNPERVQALNRLVTAEKDMNTKFAIYNWYLLDYTDDDIAQADGELAVAQANLEKAQADYDRLKNGTSQAAIDLAEATLADAQREYERVKDGPSQDDIDAAQAAVDAAQATLDQAHLLAPFSGTITEMDVNSGDLVSSGEQAFRLDDLSTVLVDLQISEVDINNLQIGQQVALTFDAIPTKEYNGEVTTVGVVGTGSQGVVNYPVTVQITDPDQSIKSGMTAAVSIVTAQHDSVLMVPNQAIRVTGQQRTVTVLFEGQQIPVQVTVGLTNETMSEVSGDQLREGDEVVINTSAAGTQNNFGQRGPGFIGGGFFR